MAKGLNKVLLLGNVGKDPEIRETGNGTQVMNFSIATPRSFKDASGEWKEETDWHDIVLWKPGRLSEFLAKGSKIYVEGRLQTRSWEDQNGVKKYRTEVVVNAGDVILCGSKGETSAPAQSAPIDDDDVPF